MDLRNVRARPGPIVFLTWPNLLSGFRLALVPLQLYLAWQGLAGFFMSVFVVQVLSDFLDVVMGNTRSPPVCPDTDDDQNPLRALQTVVSDWRVSQRLMTRRRRRRALARVR